MKYHPTESDFNPGIKLAKVTRPKCNDRFLIPTAELEYDSDPLCYPCNEKAISETSCKAGPRTKAKFKVRVVINERGK